MIQPANDGQGDDRTVDRPDHVMISDLPNSVDRFRDLAATRHFLAVVVSVGFSVTAVLVVIGGLMGRFGPDLIGPVLAAFALSQSAVAYFYFRR